MIGYQTAYLKAHWPVEFMAALLTADQHDTDRIAIEIDECRNMGIKIMAPDVNESFASFTVVPVPAAVWLFGSGLLGLVGIVRRKKEA